MTIPVKRKHSNHILSLYEFLRVNLVPVLPSGIGINYGDITFNSSSLDQWIDINFLSQGAGRKGETLVQFDIYARTRGKVSGGDPYGEQVDTIANLLYEVMHVDGIQVYDFTVKASPVLQSGAKLMIQNSGGTFREPEDDRYLDIEDGVVRRSLTYRLRMIEDASNAPSYYD